jgi:hypothetical protein
VATVAVHVVDNDVVTTSYSNAVVLVDHRAVADPGVVTGAQVETYIT